MKTLAKYILTVGDLINTLTKISILYAIFLFCITKGYLS